MLKINFLSFIIILLFWKLLLFINFPFLNSDGPWELSHLFSLINGESQYSTFAHDFYGEVFTTHVLEVLLFPFYFLLPTSTYTFIGIHFIIIASTISIISLLFNQQKFYFGIMSLSYLTSIYTYGMRSENYIIPLLLLIILFFNYDNLKGSFFYLVLISLLASIAVFIHPMGGVISIIIIISRLIYYNQLLKISVLLLLFGIISSLIITWGEILDYFLYYQKFHSMLNTHNFWLMGFSKYITFSLGMIPLLYFSIKRNPLINTIILFCTIIIISNFGRSYYFHYLFAIIAGILSTPMIIQKNEMNFTKTIKYCSLCCILLSFVFTHISPTFQFYENRTLGKQYREILSQVDDIAKRHPPNYLLWVPAQFGMEVMDQRNTRLHYHFYKKTSGEKISLNLDDKMLFYSKNNMNKILNKQVSNSFNELVIEQIINPYPGYLRIGTFYQLREDSLGLWSVRLNQ